LILGIFTILIYCIIPEIGSPSERAPEVAASADIRGGIKTALDRYRIDTSIYPKSLDDLIQQPADTTNWHGPYLDGIPLDPWGDKYIYEFPGKHNRGSYDLMSLGPDGKRGTDDDIGNW